MHNNPHSCTGWFIAALILLGLAGIIALEAPRWTTQRTISAPAAIQRLATPTPQIQRFSKGQSVYGEEIQLDSGPVLRFCYFREAPEGGSVTKGTVNFRDIFGDGFKPCQKQE